MAQAHGLTRLTWDDLTENMKKRPVLWPWPSQPANQPTNHVGMGVHIHASMSQIFWFYLA